LEVGPKLLHELRVHQIELEMQNDELRRTQAEMEASRARYFDLYDLAPVGYLTVSEQGLITEANLTVSTLLGVVRGSLVSRPVTRLIASEDEDICYLHLKRLFATGAPQVFELRLVHQDGTQFWARFEARAAQDADGARVCRAALSDITQRKREEEERLQFEQRLRQAQKEESLGRMAGSIAHHFNTLLGAVMGNLELAMSAVPLGQESLRPLTRAMQAARKAAELTGLMRTYLGHSEGEHATLDLSEICRQSLPMLRAAMPEDLVLQTNLRSPGPSVDANLVQMHQVLLNLITNACEAVGHGPGSIDLTVLTASAEEIPEVHRFPIGWLPQDRTYACVEVADGGGGIAHEDIEKIFDPFFTSKFAGRGLGLPVVLGIVRAHRGVIAVESEPGRRSVFRVYLPVAA